MNPETNELVNFEAEARKLNEVSERMGDTSEAIAGSARLDEIAETLARRFEKDGFEKLPPSLYHAARVALKGRARCHVSRISKGKLSKWAAQRRGQMRRR